MCDVCGNNLRKDNHCEQCEYVKATVPEVFQWVLDVLSRHATVVAKVGG